MVIHQTYKTNYGRAIHFQHCMEIFCFDVVTLKRLNHVGMEYWIECKKDGTLNEVTRNV